MNEYGLSFISDENIYTHVKETVQRYSFQMDLRKFNKNLIDPIKLTFDSKVYNKTIEEVIESEVLRQMDKSNTNLIGYFHQNIFKYINQNWVVPDQGYDIVNETSKYYVEMKNKHNTMNSSSSQKTFMRMQHTLNTNPEATCMLVEVISRRSQNIAWAISLDGESIINERIRRVSIDKFYELVTNNSYAFKNLCEKIPVILSDVIEDITLDIHQNSVFEELRAISPNLLKSIYLLSFKNYEGFDNFEI